MTSLMNAMFSAPASADPEAVRAAAKREWEPSTEADMRLREMPVDDFLEWARNVHWWLTEAERLSTFGPDELTEIVRDARAVPDAAQNVAAIKRAVHTIAEHTGAIAGLFMEIAGRIETVEARLRLEDEERVP